MKKRVEILAPAGNFECLKAAVMAGCDAVYLGGYQFGARSFAGNFSNQELKEAVEYAHLYNVKVYVTVNTLIYESEVEGFLEYVDYLVSIHIDALLIQDLGMLDLVHQTYPDLELHASTQMHIHNLECVKVCERLGLKRVVLARETDIDTIKSIRENTDLELEIFVHGALCVSYSGECLMSSLIGGRSGNRGACAGSCRHKYKLIKKDYDKEVELTDYEYLLSMKDLNTLEYLPRLLDCNIESIKIEGRMKRPSYVFAVISLYKKAVDAYYKNEEFKVTKKEIDRLKKIYDRGSTKGYLFYEDNDKLTNTFRPNHMGIKIGEVVDYKHNFVTVKLISDVSIHDGIRILGTPDVGCVLNVFKVNNKIVHEATKHDLITFKVNDKVSIGSSVLKTTDYLEQQEIIKEINSSKRKVLIDGVLEAFIGKPLKLTLIENNIKVEVVSDYIVEESINNPVSFIKREEQISKLGDTVYTFNSFKNIGDEYIFVPIKILNDLRRKAVRLLNEKRLERKTIKRYKYDINYWPNNIIFEEQGFSLKTSNINLVPNLKLFKNIYLPYNIHKYTPYLLSVNYNYPKYSDLILVGDIGGTLYNSYITDVGLNVVNSYTVRLLHGMGASRVTLSYELTDKQIEDIITSYKNRYNSLPNLELVIYGKEEMMISKYNLPLKYKVSGNTYLKDRFGNLYKIDIQNNLMLLYHNKLRKKLDFNKYFNMGINTLRFQVLTKNECNEVINILTKKY